MAVSRDDQNTFLMIGGVLIVCLIALIAVISSIWALVRDPINTVISTVSTFIRIQTLDYNFAVPIAVAPTPVPQPNPIPSPINIPPINIILGSNEKDIDYNFPVDTSSTSQFEDALFSDTNLEEMLGNGQTIQQKNLNIQIPSLNINSPIVQGLNSEDLLKEGFWVLPSERKLGKAEVVLLCSRRYFGPTDSKSCWFLDRIALENIITISYNSYSLNYKVVGINRFNGNDPLVYKASADEDLIRIVTTDPLDSNINRLVILAERVR
ncbi:MAG: sortase [Candidatus Dojkabacteria bacterium]